MILGPIWAHNPNGVSIGSFFTQLTAQGAYSLQWAALPLKIAPSHEGSEPHLICGSLAHPSLQPKRHLDRFSHFCRAHNCDRQTDQLTDRHTDHVTWSVTIDRIYVRSTVSLRCSLKQGKTINLLTYLFTWNSGVVKITGKEHYILQCSQIM